MDSALKNASKSCIAFRLNKFLHPFIILFVIKKKKLTQKISKIRRAGEKIDARFGFSTEKYSGNDISHFMNK